MAENCENGINRNKINWFPGHMKKTIDELVKKVKLCDVILYVLDARAPISTLNPKFNNIVSNKPVIFVFNKIDFVDEKMLEPYTKKLSGENVRCVKTNSTKQNSYKEIVNLINTFMIKKLERNKQKGINIPLRVMVIGVPNVGKSTLINNFAGKNKLLAKNMPGVTKSTAWVKVDGNIELLDTPGTLWPNLDDEIVAKHLAYIGSIKDDVLVLTDLAYDFILETIPKYAKLFESRYNIETSGLSALEIFDNICLKRGFIMKNKEIDYERGAKAILDDFRKGRLGKIILD